MLLLFFYTRKPHACIMLRATDGVPPFDGCSSTAGGRLLLLDQAGMLLLEQAGMLLLDQAGMVLLWY